jgi:phosphatidylserine/phosphatidylglycerophosphate/cardiolipin synthase-like enzyme
MIELIKDGQIIDVLIEQSEIAKKSIKTIVYTGHVPSARSMPKVRQLWQLWKDAGLSLEGCSAIIAGWRERSPQWLSNRACAGVLSANGWAVVEAKERPIMHPKLYLFDDDVAVIGSHNLTGQGLTYNFNLSVLTDDKAMIADLLAYYEKCFENSAFIC